MQLEVAAPIDVPINRYKCFVCRELPKQAVSCSNCKQILCWSHIRNILNSCPQCHHTPFSVRSEHSLQPILDRLRLAHPQDYPIRILSCKAFKCDFIDSYYDLLLHQQAVHPELSIEEVVFGIGTSEEMANIKSSFILPRKIGLKPKEQPKVEVELNQEDMNIIEMVSKNVYERPLPQGHVRKIPTREQATEMVKHTKRCKYEGCFSVWMGPWGTFIGGREGKTKFDMTLCAEGRELNHQLGWDYLNPCRSLFI